MFLIHTFGWMDNIDPKNIVNNWANMVLNMWYVISYLNSWTEYNVFISYVWMDNIYQKKYCEQLGTTFISLLTTNIK